jgi:hypothetical protein
VPKLTLPSLLGAELGSTSSGSDERPLSERVILFCSKRPEKSQTCYPSIYSEQIWVLTISFPPSSWLRSIEVSSVSSKTGALHILCPRSFLLRRLRGYLSITLFFRSLVLHRSKWLSRMIVSVVFERLVLGFFCLCFPLFHSIGAGARRFFFGAVRALLLLLRFLSRGWIRKDRFARNVFLGITGAA